MWHLHQHFFLSLEGLYTKIWFHNGAKFSKRHQTFFYLNTTFEKVSWHDKRTFTRYLNIRESLSWELKKGRDRKETRVNFLFSCLVGRERFEDHGVRKDLFQIGGTKLCSLFLPNNRKEVTAFSLNFSIVFSLPFLCSKQTVKKWYYFLLSIYTLVFQMKQKWLHCFKF